jgi:hypothetical protein
MELQSAATKLTDLSTKYGLGHSDGYECKPVPDHLQEAVSYDDVTAAFGLLGHIKYAMERQQAAEDAKASEPETEVSEPALAVTTVTGNFPDLQEVLQRPPSPADAVPAADAA